MLAIGTEYQVRRHLEDPGTIVSLTARCSFSYNSRLNAHTLSDSGQERPRLGLDISFHARFCRIALLGFADVKRRVEKSQLTAHCFLVHCLLRLLLVDEIVVSCLCHNLRDT